MKNKTIYRYFSAALMLAALLVFAAGEMAAQNFVNNANGTYDAGGAGQAGNGVIRFINNTGDFTGGAPLGVTADIQGVVAYSSTDPAQTVHALRYTNLVLEGGTKTVEDGVQVSGVGYAGGHCYYTDLDNGYGYYPGNAGNRTYSGEFIYASDGSDGPQSIYPEDESLAAHNRYTDLTLNGNGAKVVLNGETVNVTNNFVSEDIAETNVFGTLQLNFIGGTSVFNGDLTIGDATSTGAVETYVGDVTIDGTNVNLVNGLLNLKGAGSVDLTSTVTAQSALGYNGGILLDDNIAGQLTVAAGNSLILAGDDATNQGTLTLGDNTTMQIAGVLDDQGDGSNMDFQLGSTVIYNGAANQVIERTIESNPYANLSIVGGGQGATAPGGANQKLPEGNLFVNETFTLGGAGDATFLNMTDPAESLIMLTSAAGDASFGDLSEVTGTFERRGISTGENLLFNNSGTLINFATGPTTSFTMNITPLTTPASYIDYDSDADISRLVLFDYDAGSPAADVFQVAYRNDEVPAAVTDQSLVRMIEGYDSGNRGQIISNGETYGTQASAANQFGYVQLPSGSSDLAYLSGTGPGNNDQVYDQNAVVLSFGATEILSMRHGRWSDPGTWGGVTPYSVDFVTLRHIVYTGYEGVDAADTPFGSRRWLDNESDMPYDNVGAQLAARVTINDPDTGGTDPNADDANSALLIMNKDTDMAADFVYVFGLGTDGLNNNNNIGTMNWTVDDFSDPTTTQKLNGLYVRLCEGARRSIAGFTVLVNDGNIENHGEIEIGH